MKKQLNSWAVMAAKGCNDAKDKLLKHYLTVVTDHAERLWQRISNDAKFECDCLKALEGLLKSYDHKKGGDFDSLARFRIDGLIKTHLNYRSSQFIRSVGSLDSTIEGDDGSDRQFETTANVDIEGDYRAKEMIALLTQGDQRKKFILENWLIGNDNDKKLSELLAQRFDGKPSSHRRYIQRFRESCRVSVVRYGFNL